MLRDRGPGGAETPAAWDMTTVAGTAFARYAREAVDYATGRRLIEE